MYESGVVGRQLDTALLLLIAGVLECWKEVALPIVQGGVLQWRVGVCLSSALPYRVRIPLLIGTVNVLHSSTQHCMLLNTTHSVSHNTLHSATAPARQILGPLSMVDTEGCYLEQDQGGRRWSRRVCAALPTILGGVEVDRDKNGHPLEKPSGPLGFFQV